MIENKKVINRSLVVLFLSLSIVYSLTYQKKQSVFKSTRTNLNEITNQAGILNQNGSIVPDSVNLTKDSADTKTKKMSESVSLGGNKSSGATNSNIQASNDSVSANVNSVDAKILPGTTEYFGTLDIVSILGEKPKFTLQDARGNYFAYYGDHLDFVKTVQTLGGDVYEMVTETEIVGNQLFGDRVSYINLSMFRDIWVLMVIEIDGDVWLLQVPADKYHYSKVYLKSLFIQ